MLTRLHKSVTEALAKHAYASSNVFELIWLTCTPQGSLFRLQRRDFNSWIEKREPRPISTALFNEMLSDSDRSKSALPSVYVDGKHVSLDEISNGDVPEEIDLLQVTGRGANNKGLRFSHRRIKAVHVMGNHPVEFVDCRINEFHAYRLTRVTLLDCFVRAIHAHALEIEGRSVAAFEDLDVNGGCLYRFHARAAAGRSADNPFQGRVTISNLYLPRTRKYSPNESSGDELAFRTYEYRNIRSYLAKKSDTTAAGIFHAAELALERKTDKIFYCMLSWFYELISDYGNRASRALFWLFATYITFALFVYQYNTIQVPACDRSWASALVQLTPKGAGLYGWQTDLCTDAALRSAVFPLYSMTAPLNVFANPPLFVATSWHWTALHALFSAVFLLTAVLFILAVRRRFKLESPSDSGS